METNEIKKQLIEMIEGIDDEELLYLLKEDFVFHATSKAMQANFAETVNAEDHEFNDTSIKKNKLRIAGNGYADTSFY